MYKVIAVCVISVVLVGLGLWTIDQTALNDYTVNDPEVTEIKTPPEKTEIVKQEKIGNLVYTYKEEINQPLMEKQPPRLNSNNFQDKKALIDSTFTCDNFHDLAFEYRGQALPGFYVKDVYVGTFEGYIYDRAFNECIDPKYQEKLDKVYAELELVNEEN